MVSPSSWKGQGEWSGVFFPTPPPTAEEDPEDEGQVVVQEPRVQATNFSLGH